ncbi:PilN domain-containing protein [Burkholderia sp. Ac-20365]|jgi:hypothetical protein|uniref:PilN domain-containing protein n=1 Tax=Burkholderia sp. Ac-20365 TaxID=2703897 RepID=UPI00197B565A|nr:PilN domain-containing protein [Burkholderia sp. Ac-20365]MBN3759423.1 hypothetical protein [Burkholderia sp. Ac-20365]
MTRLRWNFAVARFRLDAWTFACIVALAGSAHAVYWREELLQQRERLVGQVQDIHRPMARGHQAPAKPSPVLAHVFEELRYPWTEVLDSLQRASNPGLDLVELAPDAADVRRVRVQGLADHAQNVFDLITKLQADPSWTSVQLISQIRSDADGTSQPGGSVTPQLPSISARTVAFVLVAEWKQP